MNKLTSFGYKALCQAGGVVAILIGWWISMLNISINRYYDRQFVNFWTLFGLALILLGAFVPQFLIKLYNRKQHQQELEAARLSAQINSMPLPPTSPQE